MYYYSSTKKDQNKKFTSIVPIGNSAWLVCQALSEILAHPSSPLSNSTGQSMQVHSDDTAAKRKKNRCQCSQVKACFNTSRLHEASAQDIITVNYFHTSWQKSVWSVLIMCFQSAYSLLWHPIEPIPPCQPSPQSSHLFFSFCFVFKFKVGASYLKG